MNYNIMKINITYLSSMHFLNVSFHFSCGHFSVHAALNITIVFTLSMIQVDNNGQNQIAEDTYIRNEGYRIDLSSATTDYSKTTSYTSTDGHTVRVLIAFGI